MRYKIRAHIGELKERDEEILDMLWKNIPYSHVDNVFEFELVIRKVNDITEEVGVDKDGYCAFEDVEIVKVEREQLKEIEDVLTTTLAQERKHIQEGWMMK